MSVTCKVPKLRFKEFNEEWEEKKLGDLGVFKGGGTPSTSNESYWTGSIPWISSSDLIEQDIHNIHTSRFINETSVKESATKIISQNSILFVSRVGVGKVAINKLELCTSQDFTNLILNSKNNSYFIGYYFLSKKNLLIRYSQGTSIKGFTTSDIKTLKLILPQKPEQQKIASFLSAVDSRIEQLTKKEQLLREYKKGVMQKIFSQELRFKDDDGSEFPEWKPTEMSEIFNERKTYSTKGNDYQHISLTKEGVVPKTEKYERDFLVGDDTNKKYKITHLNDICYNPANLKFGVICRNQFGSGIFSPIYITFEVKKSNIIFIEYLVTRNNFINMVRKYEEGTVYERQAVKPNDFLKFKIKLPSLKEQTKIANFLSSIDKKIEQTSKELHLTKEFKKGLLQQMFV